MTVVGKAVNLNESLSCQFTGHIQIRLQISSQASKSNALFVITCVCKPCGRGKDEILFSRTVMNSCNHETYLQPFSTHLTTSAAVKVGQIQTVCSSLPTSVSSQRRIQPVQRIKQDSCEKVCDHIVKGFLQIQTYRGGGGRGLRLHRYFPTFEYLTFQL